MCVANSIRIELRKLKLIKIKLLVFTTKTEADGGYKEPKCRIVNLITESYSSYIL